jgi:hypothetical protein
LGRQFYEQFVVDDVRECYNFAKPIVESGEFGPASIAEPEIISGAAIMHVADPNGVLLIFILTSAKRFRLIAYIQ